MKAEDLRIGNYIDFEGMECIIKEIDKQGVTVLIKETVEVVWIDLFQFNPIHLTEEILLKCGFEIKEYMSNYYVTKGMLIWKCEGMLLCDKNGIQLKYLHQLQNLYYALTQKELEISL